MTYCGERSIVKGDRDLSVAVSLRCRSWGCAECAPNRKAQLTAKAIAGRPNKFLTLTWRVQPGLSPADAAWLLTRAWRLCRLRLMRLYKLKALPFLAVMERTKRGWPHLHILLRCRFLDQRVISSIMNEICASPIVWIERIDNTRKSAIYCAKYATKCEQKIGDSKRYYCSRDYENSKPLKVEDPRFKYFRWEQTKTNINAIVTMWLDCGLAVTWLSTRLVQAERPPP